MERVNVRARAVQLFMCMIACGCASAPPVAQPTTVGSTPPVAPAHASFIDDADVLPAAAEPAPGTAREELVPLNVHRAYIRSIVADPRARYFIAVDDDAVVSLHDATTGQIKATERVAIRRSNPPVISIDSSGTRIVVGVSGADAEPARTFTWNLGAGVLREVSRASAALYADRNAAISPNGTRMYVLNAKFSDGEEVSELEVRDFDSGAVVLGPFALPNPRGVSVSPSGAMLVVQTFSPDTSLLFRADTLAPLGNVEDVTSPVAFRPQGGQMIIATDAGLAVRSPLDGRVLSSIDVDSPVSRIQYAADGLCFSTYEADGVVRIRRSRTLDVVHVAHPGEITDSLTLSDCAGALVTTQSGELRRLRPGVADEGEVVAVPMSSSGQQSSYGGPLASIGNGRIALGIGEDIALLDATSGEEIARAQGGAGERSIWSTRFSSTGDSLYTTGRGFFDIWTATGARRTACAGPADAQTLPAGHLLVNSSMGMCDPESGTLTSGYAIHTARTVPRALGKDSQAYFVFDVVSRTRGTTLLGPGTRDCPSEDGPCGDVGVISPDGSRVAIAASEPNRVLVFDTTTARRVASFPLPAPAAALRFSTDSSTLFAIDVRASRSFAIRSGRATVLRAFEGDVSVGIARPGVRYVVVDSVQARMLFDIERGVPTFSAPAAEGITLVQTQTSEDAFVASRHGAQLELVLAASGRRIPLGARRLLGVASDSSRMATCENDTLRVERLDIDAPPISLGTCAQVDDAVFRPDGQAVALREGTRVVVRTLTSRETTLRVARSTTEFIPFATNERGEFSFPDAASAHLCARSPGSLVDATCRLSPVEHRIPSTTAAVLAPSGR